MRENKLDKDMKRWKKRYGCTLGNRSGYCDGNNSKRCPMILYNRKEGTKNSGCELAL